MQQTMVFVTEKRREPLCFIKKMLAELARHRRARSFAGGVENRPEALCFVKKIHVEHVFSVHTPTNRRQYLQETEGGDVINPSRISRRHDLANPPGFET